MGDDGAAGDDLLTGALYVHEVRVGGLHKTLELVLLGLMLSGGVEEINGESLVATGQTCEGPWRVWDAPWLGTFFLGLLADAASFEAGFKLCG